MKWRTPCPMENSKSICSRNITSERTDRRGPKHWCAGFTPTKGMISPGVFVPVFERNGFISRLAYCIWEQACRLLRKWMDAGETLFPISVNVSRVNIYTSDLVESICALTEKYRIPNRLLNLELTESAYTDSPQIMMEMIDQLKAKEIYCSYG